MASAGRSQKTAVVIAHALVGWAYCGAIIGLGRQLFSVRTTLVLHAIGAPVGFALMSLFYYRRYAFTSPLLTPVAFLGVVVALDLFFVAPAFEKSYTMFSSVLGTPVPFALMFAATYLTGQWARVGEFRRLGADILTAKAESATASCQCFSWVNLLRWVLIWSRMRRNSASLWSSEPNTAAGSSRLQ